jgi:lysophospholipase L1-like esterase
MSAKIRILLLATAGILLGWWFWPVQPSYANFPPTATGPWVAFGDSLTAGYGAEPGHDYPALVGRKLGVEIKNFGQYGDTTRNGLDRVETVAKLNPRVVLLCLGGNDALQQLPPAQTFSNLAAMIDRLQQQGAFVVLIGIRSTTIRDQNAGRFKRLAREKNVFYVPNILAGVLTHPQLMADYVHPNDQGYEVIAERVGKVLRPLMDRLK